MRAKIILRFVVSLILLIRILYGNGDAADQWENTMALSDSVETEESMVAPAVDELIAEALEKSPAVLSFRSRVAASRELVEPASALPDPELEFSLEENIQSISSPEFARGEILVKQEFPFPGKRSVLGKTAGAESEMEYAGLVDMERKIIREVRTIYAGLYAFDSETSTLAAARELVGTLEAAAAKRYSTGEGEQESQLKAQIELSRLTERMNDIVAERAAMAAGLNRLLGRRGNLPVGKVQDLPSVSISHEDIEGLEALALANSPDVFVKKAAVKSAEYRLESADLDFWPDFFAGAGMAFDSEYDPMAVVSFGMTLPVWQNSKQKPLKRAAGHKLAEARKSLTETEIAISSEISGLFARWNRDHKQILQYRDAIIPQTSAALNSARASYIAGRADFSVVIEDYNLWLDALAQLARRESDRFISWAGIDAYTTPFPLNKSAD